MRKIIYLLAFTTILHAQEIVQLKEFSPFQRAGDTIYFNRNGYDVVKVVEPISKKTKKDNKIVGYKACYYVLTNDSINNIMMFINSKRLYRGIVSSWEYKKYKCFINYENDYDLDNNSYSSGRYIKMIVRGKNCDWTPPFLVDTAKERKDLSSGFSISTGVPHDLIPEVLNMYDSIANLLNYTENEHYYVYVSRYDSVQASIEPYNPCSNYQDISVANGTIEDVVKGIEKFPWPVLKIHNAVTFYDMIQTASFENVKLKRQQKELCNGFANSVKLFEQQDSVYAMIDSFNKVTVLYNVISNADDRYIVNEITEHRILDLGKSKRMDINNDGTLDLVIDSVNTPVYKSVEYIPNYPTKPKDEFTNYWYGYKTTLTYTCYLGNNYYYELHPGEDSESAYLTHVEKSKKTYLATYNKTVVNKKVYSGRGKHYRYRSRRRRYGSPRQSSIVGYQYEAMICKSDKKTRKTKDPEKAVLLKQEMINLFQYYIDHPEKLSEDFKPSNKK